MADFFDENVDDDNEDPDDYANAGKEHIVFLVDASERMLDKAGISGIEGFSEDDTYVDLSLKVIRELQKQHIIGSPKDQTAVVFYGCREALAKNSSSFSYVHIFQDLDETSAKRIKDLEMLQGEAFEQQIGSDGQSKYNHLLEGLWQASQIFAGGSGRAAKRAIVFTTEEGPVEHDAVDADVSREQLVSRAKQLHEAHIEVQLFNLTPEDREFSMDFWSEIVNNPDDELGSQSTDTEPLRIQDLILNVRRRSYKKRALTSLLWSLGPDLKIAVKLYALVQKAMYSKPVILDVATNEPLKTQGAFICSDTGAVMEKVQKYSFPKKGTAPRFPTVIMTAEERASIKQVMPRGLRLLGFKPLACLKRYHQLRNSTFVYPDERSRPGSATAFIALHDRLLHRGMFALCSIVRVRNSEPRLVALLAQEEVVDEYGTQVAPPGFNMIWLPYADDIRYPESDTSFVGKPPYPKATEEQIAAAHKMLPKLRLTEFVPGTVPNPHLQRHYQVVESLALGEEPPDFGPGDDLTLPQTEDMQQQAKEEIIAFRDSIYGEGNDGGVKPAAKKRKAAEDEDKPIDFKEMAEKGTLSTLTLPPLKDFCKNNHLSTNGRKAEVVERIVKHLLG